MRNLRKLLAPALLYIACASAGLLAALPYTYVGGPAVPGAAIAGYNPVAFGVVDGSGNVQYQQCNQALTLLPSAARTVGVASPTQTNLSCSTVLIFVNVTVASGTGGLDIHLQAMDTISSTWGDIAEFNASVKITTTGLYIISWGPGCVSTGKFNAQGQGILPQTWRINVTVSDSSSYTYSISAQVII